MKKLLFILPLLVFVTPLAFAESSNVGMIYWKQDIVSSNSFAEIYVKDNDMNKKEYPNFADKFTISVWSDSSADALEIQVVETGVYTGIFKGTVYVADSGESTKNRLIAYPGDILYAKYTDTTLPTGGTSDIVSAAVVKISGQNMDEILEKIDPSMRPSTSEDKVPTWIKNNAGWWAEGAIDDDAFVQGIQFLIKEGIITVESQSPAYEVSENYHFAAIMTNPYGMGTNTNIVLMIVDPDLSGTKKISLDKVKVEVNGVQIPISELNPLYANFIDNGSSTGIFLNEFDIERMFNKGDILEFEYFDETHYIDGGTGYSSSTFQIQ